MEQTRTALKSCINDTAVEQPVTAAVTEYFIQILDIVCIVLSVARNDYIKIFLNHFSVMMECAQTQRLSIVQEVVLPYLTKPFKSNLSFLIDCMQQPNVVRGVYRIVHKKLERKCERKACKYKEFERFEGDLGKKNEMYTGLICFNLV